MALWASIINMEKKTCASLVVDAVVGLSLVVVVLVDLIAVVGFVRFVSEIVSN